MPEAEAHEVPLTGGRRMARGLLGRHWASFLAELLLIVVGILIALYIDGRVQDYEDRKLELTSLGVMSRDLEQMIEQLQAYMAFESSMAETGTAVLKILSGEGYHRKQDVLSVQLPSMGSRRTLRLVSAAYADLTSTGSLRLIRNRALRDQLLRYFAEVERVQLIIEKNNTVFVDQLFFPFLLEKGITWVLGNRGSLTHELNRADRYFTELLGPGVKLPMNDVLSRPPDAGSWDEIRRATIVRVRVAAIGHTLAEALVEQTRDLIAAIDAEITAR